MIVTVHRGCNKVIVQQLWYGGRENNIKSKIIHEHACVGELDSKMTAEWKSN